ncbi:carbohydrate ABC transporter permease [Paenibacillus filicis]|uniref:Carbohydrate ABC transporter permease n=1 Tax=Paenibacillus filicis TaxID=669464 RepID=A0ABU9DL58_9BACL
MSNKRGAVPVLIHGVLIIYVLLTLYPLFWALQNSFKRHVDIISSPFALIKNFTLVNYVDAWYSSKVSVYFVNSLLVSAVSSTVTVVLAAMTAYALTRMPFGRMNKVVTSILLLAIMIPGATLLVPLYTFIRNFQQYFGFPIYDTYLSLILPYITFGLSMSVIVIRAFMAALPRELEEAGVMDGLKVYGVFFRVVLPLCMPALVTVFIISYLGNWNEFIMANLLISKEQLRTLAVGTAAFKDMLNTNYGGLYAAAMYSVIPVIILYMFLQDQIIEGLTSGSVKG